MEIEGFWNRRKNEWELAEYQAWVSGAYNLRAIASAFSRNAKYPGNPMQEESINVEELTDDELAGIQEQYLFTGTGSLDSSFFCALLIIFSSPVRLKKPSSAI